MKAYPMKVLVTGAQGFVGRYLVASLRAELGERATVFPSSRAGGLDPTLGEVARLDITDTESVESTISRLEPTHVVHLAGLSVIAAAAADEDLAWQIHLFGTLNIARAIRRAAPDCTLLHVGSGQVYGRTAQAGHAMDETSPLLPTNTQMASKAAADLALIAMAEDGLKSVILRPFNHTGPRQSDKFVLPNFAMQVARIKMGRQPPVIRVGNLDVERDFLDVRDVAMAYVRAVEASDRIESGTILNIASGVPRRIQALLETLIRLSETAVAIEADGQRVRPNDIVRFVGDASRARRVLGWAPSIPFEQTLLDILEDSYGRIRGEAGD